MQALFRRRAQQRFPPRRPRKPSSQSFGARPPGQPLAVLGGHAFISYDPRRDVATLSVDGRQISYPAQGGI